MEESVWWWLSFADDDGSRGVAIVQGADLTDAVLEASRLGCNPGGEVMGYPLPDGNPDAVAEREHFGVNRLILPAELSDQGYRNRGQLVDEAADDTDARGRTLEEFLDDTTQTICQEHNDG